MKKSKKLLMGVLTLSSLFLVGCQKRDKNPSDTQGNTTNTSGQKDETKKVESISVKELQFNLTVGQRKQINVDFLPTDATNKLLAYSSSNENVASVSSSGVVKGESASDEEVTITVTSLSNSNAKASVKVHVSAPVDTTVKVASIQLAKDSISIEEGGKETIQYSLLPEDATDKKVNFKSADESVCEVTAEGKVIASKVGETSITLTSNSNPDITAQVSVTVTEKEVVDPSQNEVHVTSIKANPNPMNLKMGDVESMDIGVDFTPTDTTNKKLTYSSSDDTIAIVTSAGVVIAQKPGSAQITITSDDNNSVKDIIDVEIAEEDKPVVPVRKQITTMSLSGLETTYGSDDSINWSNARLHVSYDDESEEDLDNSEQDCKLLDNGKYDVRTSTEFILFTEGLSSCSNGNLIVKSYKITAVVVGYEDVDPIEVSTITVVNSITRTYNLNSFSEPESIVTFKNNVNSAEQDSETSYKVKQQYYTIGDDNEFIFSPESTVSKKSSPTKMESIHVKLKAEVRELDQAGNASSLLADNTVYSFNENSDGFDFTDAAVGNRYEISVLPKDFTTINAEEITPIKLKIEVKDGYNVYNALDLGRINITSEQTKVKIDKDTNRCDGGAHATYNNQQSQNYFYDENNVADDYEKREILSDLWSGFLTSKGETNLNEINGAFLHNNISIKLSDIPEDYIISPEEARKRAGDYFAANTLRDRSRLYTHILADNDFNLNGNCFKLDTSNIPLCRSNSEAPTFVYSSNQSTIWMGHATLFEFANRYDGERQPNYNASTALKAHIENISSNGNTGGVVAGDQSLINDAAGGLIFYDSCYGISQINNLIVRNYMIGINGEGEYSNKTMEIRNSRIYDCFNSAVFCWASENNTIDNCELKRFGGPAIFLNSLERYKDKSDKSKGSWYGKAGISATNSIIESYINGTEAWFNINHATTTATQITGDFATFMKNMYNAPILCESGDNNGKMNMPVLGLDSAYIGSGAEPTRINFQMDDYTAFNTYDSEVEPTAEDKFRTAYPTAITNSMQLIEIVNNQAGKSHDQFGYIDPSSGFVQLNKQSDGSYTPEAKYPVSFVPANAFVGDYVHFFMHTPIGADIAMILQIQHPTQA